MTGRIFFLDAQGRRIHGRGWTGPWPPPERMIMLIGKQSGMISFSEPDKNPDLFAAARELGTIIETRYRLRNASTIERPADADARWFRGAEYVPEDDDA